MIVYTNRFIIIAKFNIVWNYVKYIIQNVMKMKIF